MFIYFLEMVILQCQHGKIPWFEAKQRLKLSIISLKGGNYRVTVVSERNDLKENEGYATLSIS